MADAAAILARIRAKGADVHLTDGRLTIDSGGRLSPEARNYIVAHRAEIVAFLEEEQRQDAIEERAAIIEFEAGAPRDWANEFARVLYQRRPPNVTDMDWFWFVTACGRIIDEAPRAAA
jgi:hypothetical protein